MFTPVGYVVRHWNGSTITTAAPGTCATINDAGHIAWSAREENSTRAVYVTDRTEVVLLGAGGERPVINESGDVAWATFNGMYLASIIKPLTPIEAIQALIGAVEQLDVQTGITNSLNAQLGFALRQLEVANAESDIAAAETLNAFISSIRANSGNHIDTSSVNELIEDAGKIIA